jgi:hypothetical protein
MTPGTFVLLLSLPGFHTCRLPRDDGPSISQHDLRDGVRPISECRTLRTIAYPAERAVTSVTVGNAHWNGM